MNNREELLNIWSCKYIDEVINYIDFASQSKAIINNKDIKTMLMGYRIITHIFQTNLLHTGDIDRAQMSMQKGYTYYTEYLEQIEASNAKNHLNHQSATMFIYDKSIINYAQDDRPAIKVDNVLISSISRFVKLIETILWLENNIIKQSDIDFNVIKRICHISHTIDDNLLSSYIEFGQKRIMNTVEYNEFLNHAFKIFREDLKHTQRNEKDWNEQLIKKIPHIEEAQNMTISKWCKWSWF